MADNWNELIQSKKKSGKENNIDGTFDCQVCDECVSGAHYDHVEGTMEWVCLNGHTSKIKAQF